MGKLGRPERRRPSALAGVFNHVRTGIVCPLSREEANISALCRGFGISRKTGYRWLARYQAGDEPGLADTSRRPHHSPTRTPAALEAAVLRVRAAYPAWGGRNIKAWLERSGTPAPSPSSLERARRPLAFCPRPGGVSQPTSAHGADPATAPVCALRPPPTHPERQRSTLGDEWSGWHHRLRSLADPSRHPQQPWALLSSPRRRARSNGSTGH